jgi:hypothetical protein
MPFDEVLETQKRADITYWLDPMLVPDKLAYPSSIRGYASCRGSRPPEKDLTVDVALLLRSKAGRSSGNPLTLLAAELPYKLEPDLIE